MPSASAAFRRPLPPPPHPALLSVTPRPSLPCRAAARPCWAPAGPRGGGGTCAPPSRWGLRQQPQPPCCFSSCGLLRPPCVTRPSARNRLCRATRPSAESRPPLRCCLGRTTTCSCSRGLASVRELQGRDGLRAGLLLPRLPPRTALMHPCTPGSAGLHKSMFDDLHRHGVAAPPCPARMRGRRPSRPRAAGGELQCRLIPAAQAGHGPPRLDRGRRGRRAPVGRPVEGRQCAGKLGLRRTRLGPPRREPGCGAALRAAWLRPDPCRWWRAAWLCLVEMPTCRAQGGTAMKMTCGGGGECSGVADGVTLLEAMLGTHLCMLLWAPSMQGSAAHVSWCKAVTARQQQQPSAPLLSPPNSLCLQVWRLSFPALKWQRAEVPEGSELPARRRGHSTMHYTVRLWCSATQPSPVCAQPLHSCLPPLRRRRAAAGRPAAVPPASRPPCLQPLPVHCNLHPWAAQDAAGIDHIVIFGGRTKGKEPLNDAWDVKLRWPNASWRCITPQQPAGKAAPEPRRGHSAVLVSDPGAAEPQMVRAAASLAAAPLHCPWWRCPWCHRASQCVATAASRRRMAGWLNNTLCLKNATQLVYGGRAEEQYFDDMWLLVSLLLPAPACPQLSASRPCCPAAAPTLHVEGSLRWPTLVARPLLCCCRGGRWFPAGCTGALPLCPAPPTHRAWPPASGAASSRRGALPRGATTTPRCSSTARCLCLVGCRAPSACAALLLGRLPLPQLGGAQAMPGLCCHTPQPPTLPCRRTDQQHRSLAHPYRLPAAGRSGENYSHSHPLNSLWRFDLAARAWTEIQQTGDARGKPLPRFEHAYAQVSRPGSNGQLQMLAGRCWPAASTASAQRWGGACAAAGLMAWCRHVCGGMATARGVGKQQRACSSLLPPAASAPADSALVVFGGQTTVGVTRRQRRVPCQMNDVWSLSLSSLIWREVTPPRWCNKKCEREHRHDGDG